MKTKNTKLIYTLFTLALMTGLCGFMSKNKASDKLGDNWEKFGPNTPRITEYINTRIMRQDMEKLFHAGDPTLMLLQTQHEDHGHDHDQENDHEDHEHDHDQENDQEDHGHQHINEKPTVEKKDYAKWAEISPIFYLPKKGLKELDHAQTTQWRLQTKEAQGESNKILIRRLRKHLDTNPFAIWIYHDTAYFCVNFFFDYKTGQQFLEEGWQQWEKLKELAIKYPEINHKYGRDIIIRSAQMDAAKLALLGIWFSKDQKNTGRVAVWDHRFTTIALAYNHAWEANKKLAEQQGQNPNEITIKDTVTFKKGEVDPLTYNLYISTWESIKMMVQDKIQKAK